MADGMEMGRCVWVDGAWTLAGQPSLGSALCRAGVGVRKSWVGRNKALN